MFPNKKAKTAKQSHQVAQTLSRKQARRAEYARTQDLWRKNRSKCLRMLLDDVADVHARDVMVPFWKEVMRGRSDISPVPDNRNPLSGSFGYIRIRVKRHVRALLRGP
ncbi:hypothetical protein P5V15_015377 [Pogonomyrmex californicus]